MIFARGFDLAQPDGSSIAQFVELARRGPQHSAEVLRRVAGKNSAVCVKRIDKKSSSQSEAPRSATLAKNIFYLVEERRAALGGLVVHSQRGTQLLHDFALLARQF